MEHHSFFFFFVFKSYTRNRSACADGKAAASDLKPII